MKFTGVNSLIGGFDCPCGKRHEAGLCDFVIGDGVLSKISEIANKYGVKHPYVLCDKNTYMAAGERVAALLDVAGIPYTLHVIPRARPVPDEQTVGEALMYCTAECDAVIAVGGGVINDTGKLIASAKCVPDIYVATAPSMDGFASATSSMERAGLKVSLPSKCPECVIADTEILASAPVHLIRSGIGDMLAKYVSIAEWQLSHLITGEYYCAEIAELVLSSLEVCVENARAAVRGDREAVKKLTEGLTVSGVAMNFAGISRPASGMEHYISHIIDMRALEFGSSAELHGIQCGIATLTTLRAYDRLAEHIPDRDCALEYVRRFDYSDWAQHLRFSLGHGAEAIIAGEAREGKYDKSRHAARLSMILGGWGEITKIIRTLPSPSAIEKFMHDIGHPISYSDIGLAREEYADAFEMAKDIRDKYVLGRLLWDLGILDLFSVNVE